MLLSESRSKRSRIAGLVSDRGKESEANGSRDSHGAIWVKAMIALNSDVIEITWR
jgi:hypothetical protein